MKDNSDLKYFLISLALHLSLFLVMAVKIVLFPGERLEHMRAVRVDFVALPDKEAELGPPGEEKPAEEKPAAPAEPEKPPAVVEKPKEKKAETKKVEPKVAEKKPEKTDLKDQQSSALQRLAALSRIKKQKATDSAKPEGVTVKGNRISEGNSLTGVEKIEYNRYLSDLDLHIKKNWHLPEWLATKQLTTAIFLRFDEKGQILEKKLVRSSGNKAFDNEAMQAVMNSVPFPAPPENLISYFQSQGIELRFPE
jgi:colicin import membrane protein